MEFLLCVLLVVFLFEYINGFHDAGNAIATVVSTKVLRPREAVALAAAFNFLGALSGEAVAKTIGSGLVDTTYVTTLVILAGAVSGIIWNLFTWWYGLPTSSTHALIGGLCGATAASAGSWQVIKWSVRTTDPVTGAVVTDGILHTVVIPMFTSPIVGLIGGFLLLSLLYQLLATWRPATISKIFGRLQVFSAAYMGWGHGFADAQKTMGIIALATFAATKSGELENLPAGLRFLYNPSLEIHLWVKIACAFVMAAGTWAGGWRIVRTLGCRIVALKPVDGFAAETAGATILLISGKMGMPVSTTQVITAAIVGAGIAKRPSSLGARVVERIVLAWVLTIPVTALLAYCAFHLFSKFEWI